MNVYYVYVYLDPRKPGNFIYDEFEFGYEPIYVGKGTKSRLLRHLKEKVRNPIKINKINKIRKEGKNPIILKIIDKISNEYSLEIEKRLIKKIGRINKKTGPLTNCTEGGETYLGYKHQEEYLQKLYKPVIKYDKEGNFIEEYKSVKEAGEKNNMHPQTISQICNGGIKIYKNEFIFLYKGEKFEKRVRNKKEYSVVRIDYNMANKEYKSVTEAANDNNTTPSRINAVCMGDRFQTGGFLFRYINHPNLKEYTSKINERFGKYLKIMDKKININGLIYKNILDVISKNSNVKVGNLYQLLHNDNKKIYKFNELKTIERFL